MIVEQQRQQQQQEEETVKPATATATTITMTATTTTTTTTTTNNNNNNNNNKSLRDIMADIPTSSNLNESDIVDAWTEDGPLEVSAVVIDNVDNNVKSSSSSSSSSDTEAAKPEPASANNIKRSSSSNKGIAVSFERLTYTVPIQPIKDDKDGKKEVGPKELQILKNLNGCFVPGKLTALMGPSGSGKTTLLDVLAGRKNSGTVDGNIYFQNHKPTMDDFRYIVGYVEQFDTLVGELTVENMLHYTSELKLPSSMSKEERRRRVEEVIQMLDLESCRKTIIGSTLMRGISGGQAKRVNIGLALITRPPILFLDEPTSGLDSRTANEVVELLKELAHDPINPRTVVCTIHSPTGHAFSFFENLIMIHQGQTIYDGPVSKAQTYFENHGHIRDPDASLPEWLVDLTSDLQSILKRKSSMINLTDVADVADDDIKEEAPEAATATRSASFIELFQSSEMKLVSDQSRKDLLSLHHNDQSTLDRTLDSSKHSINKSSSKLVNVHHRPPSEFSKLITLLKYRSVAHYQDGEYLGPRFGDKVLFALLILSLYYGIGDETDPQSIASMASLLFFITALCGFGAGSLYDGIRICFLESLQFECLPRLLDKVVKVYYCKNNSSSSSCDDII